jgi:hypothetical protein
MKIKIKKLWKYLDQFFSYKNCKLNQNTHFMYSNFFFRTPCLFEIQWKNTAEADRPQMTIQYDACASHVD